MSEPVIADAAGRREAAPGEERLRERCLANPLWAKFYQGWELIGRGGFGTVIGTRHRTFGAIAVKTFEWLSPQEETRFDQEAAALARLNHPSIVRIYGAFKDDGLYWFEMERVHGPTLKEALEARQREDRPFSMDEVLEIALNITEALQAAHAAGVIHRDVKPGNVLLPEPRDGRGPRAKLGDFGVSRLFDAGRLTATGVVVGSYEYAAPELFAGKTAAAASDVYAFTLLLYRLLTGNAYPYEINGDRTPVAFMEAHTKQVPLPIGLLNRHLTQDLQDLITLGLSKDPRRRPSWDEILLALKREQSSERLVTAREKAAPQSTGAMSRAARAAVRRLRTVSAVRYILGATLIVVGGLTLLIARGTPSASSRAEGLQQATPHNSVPAPALAANSSPPADPAQTEGTAAPLTPAKPAAPDAGYSFAQSVVVEWAGDTLQVRNVSSRTVSVRVTAVTGAGSRHAATVTALEPRLQQTIFLDALEPPLTDSDKVIRVDVVELNAASKLTTPIDRPRR